MRESLHVLTFIRRDAPTLMHLKSRMHPTAQHARSINGQQSSLDQERNHARAKQLLQPRVIAGLVGRIRKGTEVISISDAVSLEAALTILK